MQELYDCSYSVDVLLMSNERFEPAYGVRVLYGYIQYILGLWYSPTVGELYTLVVVEDHDKCPF